MKTITYKKEKLHHPTGRKTENVHTEKDIEIRPGYSHDQEVRFVEEGHDVVRKPSGDLVVKIIQTPHPEFERHGNHLIYTKKIEFDQSLLPESFEVITLDDRILNVSVNETISQSTATVVRGEGMPILNNDDPLVSLEKRHKKGDLIIRYDIQFPKFISDKQKKKLSKLLG